MKVVMTSGDDSRINVGIHSALFDRVGHNRTTASQIVPEFIEVTPVAAADYFIIVRVKPIADFPITGAMIATVATMLLALLQEQVNALLIGSNHIQAPVQVNVGNFKLSAWSTVVIEQVGRPYGLAVFARESEPIEDGRHIAARIASAVCPPTLACYQVWQTIAIHIRQARTMRL